MSKDTILDEMDLPLDNPNENLETISRNKFKPLLDVEKFEIRDEFYRDKGIDFNIEIKSEGRYTNFKFSVQLKATDSKEHHPDGSISLQLNTSNINYLLNSGMPAFYVLYLKQSDTFFYENLNDFVRLLYEKDAEWANQKSHTLRFSKKLIEPGITEMYETTLKKGVFQREINEKLAIKSAIVNTGDKILFDADFNVTSDSEVRKLIEGIGLELINEAKWKEILIVHKKASGDVASTAKYNLVLGVAHYYSGHFIDALSFFKAALKMQAELSDDLKNHLYYFETSTKFSLGLIQLEGYLNKIREFEKDNNIGLYVRLENVKRNYFESIDTNSDERYKQLVKEVDDIISDPKSNNNITLNAKCEMILIEGSKNNIDHINRTALLNAAESQIGHNVEMRANALFQYLESHSNWYRKVTILKSEAIELKNYFAYFIACLNEAKVLYESDVCSTLISLEEDRPGVAAEMPDKKPLFDQIQRNIDGAYEYFDKIGHVENMLVSLSVKYEFLHYQKDFTHAGQIMNQMVEIVETYEMSDQKRRLQHLKNNGTTHQKLKAFLEDISATTEIAKNEYKTMRAEMVNMDDAEKEEAVLRGSSRIELFPIGYFSFLFDKKGEVFKILNIADSAIEQFDFMFTQGITPVANIFHNPIVQEGYLEGNLADKGIENWRNIYRIRKAFHENCFYRDRKL